MLGYQVVGFALTIAATMLAAVAVPPKVFGDYYYMLSLIQVTLGIALTWMAQAVALFARQEVQDGGSGGEALASAFAGQGVTLVIVAAGGLAVWWALPNVFAGSAGAVLAMGAALVMFAVLESVSYALQAMHRFEGIGLCTALSKLGPLGAVAAVWAGLPATAEVLLLGTAGGLAVALAAAYRVLPAGYAATVRPRWQTLRNMLAYGWRLPMAGAAGILSAWMHIWFVRAYGGAAEAGVYAWAASLHVIATATLMSLSSVLAPDLIDLALRDDRKGAMRRLGQIMAGAAGLAIVMPAVMGMLRVMGLALPGQYAAAGPVLVLLLATLPAQLLTILSGPLRRAYPAMIASIVAINVATAVLNLGLNFVLTPTFGVTGAAVSLGLSVWFNATALLIRFRHHLTGGSAGSGRQLATLGVTVLGAALAIAHLAPAAALALGLGLSVIYLVAFRAMGMLYAMGDLPGDLGALPLPLRRALVAGFAWCARRPRPTTDTES